MTLSPETTIRQAEVLAELRALASLMFVLQSKRRIIEAWRAGRISRDKAAMLIRECGLEGVPW